MSAVRKVALAAICMSAILLAVACRPSPAFRENAPFEERDRKLRAELTQIERSHWQHFENVDWDAGPGPLESLEAEVRKNPDDLGVLRQLLVSYWEPLWRVAPASLDASVAALPEPERFEQLPNLARNAYGTIESIARWNDPNL